MTGIGALGAAAAGVGTDGIGALGVAETVRAAGAAG